VLTGDVYKLPANREKFRPIVREWEQKLTSLLENDQFQRLEQLTFQQQKGANVLLHPHVSGELGLTSKQIEEINEIVTVAMREGASLSVWNRMRRGPQLALAARDKAFAVLTDDQRDRWKAFLGPPGAE
jgi:hypothetical protein